LQQQLADLASKRHQQPSVQQDVQQPWHFSQQYHFDPADCGSYPCRQQVNNALWQDLAACHQAVAQALAGAQQQALQQAGAAGTAAASCADPLQNPFGWDEQASTAAGANSSTAAGDVDAAASGRISSVRPRTAQIRSRSATSLPLEFFDSPEMEQVDIQQQLQEAAAAGGPGLQALSRFYSPDGSFSWQPCTVLQYDRC
jgi:hypothetical protein